MTHVAYLGVGSNVSPEEHVRIGIHALQDRFKSVTLSPIYRSQSVGFEGSDFLNLVARIETRLSPRQLRDWLRDLEDRHGRLRDVPKFSDRVLDIDILLFDDRVQDDEGLTLPRPEILDFAHVLRPLAELSPELRYPGLGRRMDELWQASNLQDVRLTAVSISW